MLFFSMNSVYVYVWGSSFVGMLFNMIIFSIKRDHENIFRFVSILFYVILIYFLVWMGVIVIFGV